MSPGEVLGKFLKYFFQKKGMNSDLWGRKSELRWKCMQNNETRHHFISWWEKEKNACYMYFTEGGLKFLTLSSIWYTWKFTVVNAPLNVQCPADSQNEFDSAHSVGWQVGDLLAIVLFAFVITGIL